ncbi:hypothetical protein [Rhodococcus sp. 1168]|uniref:hypothetical protein n=1 Tax=Rhodococcus sp. 1168 TaxID=2018041 RepID=UPI000F7425D3|nr:hypothetical protein [Rhodococcus sp. 1168]
MQFSEPSSGELPDFPVPRVQLMIGSVFAGFLAFIAFVISASSLVTGHLASAVAAFAFAVFVLATASFARSNQTSHTSGAPAGRLVQGSTVRYKPSGLIRLALVTASMALCAIAFGVAAGGAVAWIFATMGALLATFFVPLLITRSIRQGRLELTADGIRHRGWAFEAEIAWDGIGGVAFAQRDYPAIYVLVEPTKQIVRHYTTQFWKIEALHPGHVIELDCRRFDIHPMLLAQWIRFYIEHPDSRIELGTTAAADRLIYARF